MDFSLSEEQQLIIKTTRDFVRNELYPHEREVEETGVLREDLHRELKAKAIEAGLYAANMPVEVGGAGLDTVALGALREGARVRPITRCITPASAGRRTYCSPARANSASATCCRPCAASGRNASR